MPALPLLVLLIGCVPVLHSPDGGGTEDTGPWVAPENEWPMATPPEDLAGEGWEPGEVVPEFRLPDQHGNTVSLWQFYGMLLIVDVSTSWCAPCQQLATGVQDLADEHRDQGFVYVTLLDQNLAHEIPTQDDLNQWGDGFGISEPILADTTAWTATAWPQPAYPIVLLVDRDMRLIEQVDPADDATVRAAVESAL